MSFIMKQENKTINKKPIGKDFIDSIIKMNLSEYIEDYMVQDLKIGEAELKSLILTFAEIESGYGQNTKIDQPVKSYIDKGYSEWESKPHGYFQIMGKNLSKIFYITEDSYEQDMGTLRKQVKVLIDFLKLEIFNNTLFKNQTIQNPQNIIQNIAAMYFGGTYAIKYFINNHEYPKTDQWDVNDYVQKFIIKYNKHLIPLTEGLTIITKLLNNVSEEDIKNILKILLTKEGYNKLFKVE